MSQKHTRSAAIDLAWLVNWINEPGARKGNPKGADDLLSQLNEKGDDVSQKHTPKRPQTMRFTSPKFKGAKRRMVSTYSRWANWPEAEHRAIVFGFELDKFEARTLANWLNQFIEWADHKEKKDGETRTQKRSGKACTRPDSVTTTARTTEHARR